MSPIWEWIIGGISRLLFGLRDIAASIVGKVLATFGLTLVSFETVLPALKSYLTSYFTLLPGPALAFLSYLGVGKVMAMILSALTVRLSFKVFVMPKTAADSLGIP